MHYFSRFRLGCNDEDTIFYKYDKNCYSARYVQVLFLITYTTCLFVSAISRVNKYICILNILALK